MQPRVGIRRVAEHLLFFGGDEVSLATLAKLHARAREHKFRLHVIHPPDPVTTSSSQPASATMNVVADYCRKEGIAAQAVDHPKSISKSSLLLPADALTQFDASVVCSCRYFLPNGLLERIPPAINMHPSLLPRYRGASPIYETLRRGDPEGGASVIKLLPSSLMDSGDLLLQRRLPIGPTDDLRTYFTRAADTGADAVVECVDDFASKWAAALPQPRNTLHFREDPEHAPLLSRHPGRLCWEQMSGLDAYNTWRAFVSYAPITAIFKKAATPCAGKIKSDAKKSPMAIVFNEAQHASQISEDVHRELTIVADEAKPGAAYFPFTLNGADGKRVGAVRCSTGWFFYRLATLKNGVPITPKVLAATAECKPGLVYNGVFASAV
jgi:methionyl-tRNA formyltransferase